MPLPQNKNPPPAPSFHLSQGLSVVGTATCDWQANPLHEASEWGEEVRRALTGKRTGLHGFSSAEDLPSLDGRWDAVLDRAAELGGNTFRLSLDFAELCPAPGVFRDDLMRRYLRLLAGCRLRGLEPVVTLHHWTHPKTFAHFTRNGRMTRAPLEHPGIVEHFRSYVERVASILFDPAEMRAVLSPEEEERVATVLNGTPIVSRFITLNEPSSMVFHPYVLGIFPPYKRFRILKALSLEKKLGEMHRIAYETLHATARARGLSDAAAPQVGMSHGVVGSVVPILNHLAGWGLLERMERGQHTDFVGVQYYARSALSFSRHWPFVSLRGFDPGTWSDASECEVYPPGIRDVLHRAARLCPGKPLLVSEFGFADRTDRKRPAWILQTVSHMLRAAAEGVPLTGALLWTITDNLEWHEGMRVRYGIFDKDGNRLPSDDGVHLTSREAWSACSKHLLHPTQHTAEELSRLLDRAEAQLNEEVGREARESGRSAWIKPATLQPTLT